jgi:hypothetical protein
MVNYFQLTDNLKREIINQTSLRTGMNVKAIEKDWWVTLALKALFSMPQAEHFIFKGGTSLSKAWKLIERFSEDIDIALAPEAFGYKYEKIPSHSYVKSLKREGCIYTSTVIKDSLQERLSQMGVPDQLITIHAEAVRADFPDKDPQTIFIRYPSLYDANNYIAEEVKVEFGVRSLKEPYGNALIQSIISEQFPNPAYSETPFTATTVQPHKTFLEKLFLLHEKFALPDSGKVGDRQSRHLSDLASMMNTDAEKIALQDQDFYNVLVKHRSHYTRLKGIDYNSLKPDMLSFLPPENLMDQFRQDYAKMQQEMIYGQSPDFDSLIAQLTLLNGKFNQIGNN